MRIVEVISTNKPRLYIDMDGVIADLYAALRQLYPNTQLRRIHDKKMSAIPFDQRFTDNVYSGLIDELRKQGRDVLYDTFLKLGYKQSGKKMMDWIIANKIPFTILSAPTSAAKLSDGSIDPEDSDTIGRSINCVRAKRDWLRKLFGEQVANSAIFNNDKASVLKTTPGAILVDDRDKYINSWRDAGGVPLKFTDNPDWIISQLSKIYNIPTSKFTPNSQIQSNTVSTSQQSTAGPGSNPDANKMLEDSSTPEQTSSSLPPGFGKVLLVMGPIGGGKSTAINSLFSISPESQGYSQVYVAKIPRTSSNVKPIRMFASNPDRVKGAIQIYSRQYPEATIDYPGVREKLEQHGVGMREFKYMLDTNRIPPDIDELIRKYQQTLARKETSLYQTQILNSGKPLLLQKTTKHTDLVNFLRNTAKYDVFLILIDPPSLETLQLRVMNRNIKSSQLWNQTKSMNQSEKEEAYNKLRAGEAKTNSREEVKYEYDAHMRNREIILGQFQRSNKYIIAKDGVLTDQDKNRVLEWLYTPMREPTKLLQRIQYIEYGISEKQKKFNDMLDVLKSYGRHDIANTLYNIGEVLENNPQKYQQYASFLYEVGALLGNDNPTNRRLLSATKLENLILNIQSLISKFDSTKTAQTQNTTPSMSSAKDEIKNTDSEQTQNFSKRFYPDASSLYVMYRDVLRDITNGSWKTASETDRSNLKSQIKKLWTIFAEQLKTIYTSSSNQSNISNNTKLPLYPGMNAQMAMGFIMQARDTLEQMNKMQQSKSQSNSIMETLIHTYENYIPYAVVKFQKHLRHK